MPNADAIAACRATGRWWNVSWNPSGKPDDQDRRPDLDPLELLDQVRRRERPDEDAPSAVAERSSASVTTSMVPAESLPCRQSGWPSR